MELNYQNTKIYNFLIENKKIKLGRLFLKLFDKSINLDKKELKELFRLVGKKLTQDVELKLIKMLKKYDIDMSEKSTIRVRKYRDNIKAKGYKHLSLQIPPEEYEKLKTLKIKNDMSYSNLIIFLINNQKTS